MYDAKSKGKSILRSTLMLEWQRQERQTDETEHANLANSWHPIENNQQFVCQLLKSTTLTATYLEATTVFRNPRNHKKGKTRQHKCLYGSIRDIRHQRQHSSFSQPKIGWVAYIHVTCSVRGQCCRVGQIPGERRTSSLIWCAPIPGKALSIFRGPEVSSGIRMEFWKIIQI